MSAHGSTAIPFQIPHETAIPRTGSTRSRISYRDARCPRTARFYLWAVMAAAIATPVTAIAILCLVGS